MVLLQMLTARYVTRTRDKFEGKEDGNIAGNPIGFEPSKFCTQIFSIIK